MKDIARVFIFFFTVRLLERYVNECISKICFLSLTEFKVCYMMNLLWSHSVQTCSDHQIEVHEDKDYYSEVQMLLSLMLSFNNGT